MLRHKIKCNMWFLMIIIIYFCLPILVLNTACMLKEEKPKYDRIIEFCDRALEVSPTNLKALYRKASSQYACRDYEEALKTLEKVQPGELIYYVHRSAR